MTARPALIVIALLGLAACGNLQVPPRDINRPPPARTQPSTQAPEQPAPRAVPTKRVSAQPVAPPKPVQASRGSDSAFVGASAVTVGPGDTVYAISRRHRVPVPAIIRANGLEPPYHLIVGQRIALPRGPQHRVAAGDTLYSIAHSYDVGLYELARLNDIDAPYTVRLGEVLVIPAPDKPAAARRPQASQPPKSAAAAPAPRQIERAPKPQAGEGEIALIPPKKPPAPVPPPPPRTRSGFVWPVKGTLISSFGGKAGGLRNDGINIRAPRGSAVVAAENGVVAYAGNEIRGFGNLLLIKHQDGYVTAYAHNDTLLVQRGDRVKRGQKIATVGSTGSVSEAQLHFEIRKGRRPQDPGKYLKT